MNWYDKGIMTAIAILLAVIAVGVWLPQIRHNPTVGGYTKAGNSQKLREEYLNRVPLVRTLGIVDVKGTVDVDSINEPVEVKVH